MTYRYFQGVCCRCNHPLKEGAEEARQAIICYYKNHYYCYVCFDKIMLPKELKN